jgi:hypothetical protein
LTVSLLTFPTLSKDSRSFSPVHPFLNTNIALIGGAQKVVATGITPLT